jgi:hypothetical protein
MRSERFHRSRVTIYTVFDDEVELHLLVELLMRPGK